MKTKLIIGGVAILVVGAAIGAWATYSFAQNLIMENNQVSIDIDPERPDAGNRKEKGCCRTYWMEWAMVVSWLCFLISLFVFFYVALTLC